MSKRIDGSSDAPACVADVLDIDAAPLAWKEEMEKDLGPFGSDVPSAEVSCRLFRIAKRPVTARLA